MANNDFSLSGAFELNISEDGLLARLRFSSETPHSKTWDAQAIIDLLEQSGIKNYDPDLVRQSIAGEIAKPTFQSVAGFTLTVATGLMPKEPIPERFEMRAIPVPEEWQEIVPKVLAGEMKFLQDLNEPTPSGKSSPSNVSRSKPANTNVGYARAGNIVGKVFPPHPGSLGKTVTGTNILPQTIGDGILRVGKGLTRKGAEVFADFDGIVSAAADWVEIVPFSGHEILLNQSDDKITCFLTYIPGHPALPVPTGASILQKAMELGFTSDTLLSELSIDALLRDSGSEGIERQSISKNEDGFFEILISENKQKAVLRIVKSRGNGKPLSLKEIGNALNESGLKFDRETIKQEILRFQSSTELVLENYILAQGKEPGTGPAQTASWLVTFLKDAERTELKTRALGMIDKLDIDSMASFPKDAIDGVALVDNGQKILALSPPVAPAPGIDCYGKTVAGYPGEAFQLQLYGDVEKIGSLTIVAKTQGLMLRSTVNKKTYIAVLPMKDGEVTIETTDNGMTAYAIVFAGKGVGKTITKEQIIAALTETKVVKGVDESAIQNILSRLGSGEDMVKEVVARGVAPTAGGSNEIQWQITFASGQNVTIKKDGTVDYRNRDRITTVAKDVLIARIVPPSVLPVPGWDVFGKEILPPPQELNELEIGENIRKAPESDGSILLFAAREGELKYHDKKISVTSSYTIKGNVDTSTGNIKFPGSVTITGDVMSGFVVISGGEIKVAGSVEASLLTAEHDISIAAGIKGAGKALIRTKKNVLTSFAELCTILAVSDIKIKKSLLRSRVKSNGRVIMPDDAHIIGGEIKVKYGLSVGNLGNDKGIVTKIFFGQDILVEDQIEVEEREINKIQDEMATLNTALKDVERMRDKPHLQELFNRKVTLMKTLEKHNLRLFTLKERFEQHFDSSIVITGTVWPGVVFESHGRSHTIHKPAKSLKISFDTSTGRIVEIPIGQK